MLKKFETAFKISGDLAHSVPITEIHTWCVQNSVERSELNEFIQLKYPAIKPYGIPLVCIQSWHNGFYFGIQCNNVVKHDGAYGLITSSCDEIVVPNCTWQNKLRETSHSQRQSLAKRNGLKISGNALDLLESLRPCFDKKEEVYQSEDKETLRRLCLERSISDISHLYKYELVNTLLISEMNQPTSESEKEELEEPLQVEAKDKMISRFIIFSKEMRSTIIKENPSIKFHEIGKEIGVRWGKLSDAEKDAYYPVEIPKVEATSSTAR